MIRRLSFLKASGTDPFPNMALEEYLMLHVEEGECILYLWQNEKTVVIGRNQNAYGECRTQELEEDGGSLARRLSGGGAVFHDLGNLNFTFLVRKQDYDVEKQTEVILQAVRGLGAEAYKTGRNDMAIDGRKFSGNAFYQTGEFCYHHGTLLLDADKEQMSKYLSVSGQKLQSKGVTSVKSRVINLREAVSGLNADRMAQVLIEGFGRVYGLPVKDFEGNRLDESELKERQNRFASWEWRYGKKLAFDLGSRTRFGWGELEVQITVDQGCIQEIRIFTDGLDTELVTYLENSLEHVRFNRKSIAERLEDITCTDGLQAEMKEDIVGFLCAMMA